LHWVRVFGGRRRPTANGQSPNLPSMPSWCACPSHRQGPPAVPPRPLGSSMSQRLGLAGGCCLS
jgi:hypothetical protein